MAIYEDLYMRARVGDDGTIPLQGNPCHSPDIIPRGTAPVDDPVKEFTGNFDRDVGQNVQVSQLNYIYARGTSNAPGAASGLVYLYYSPASLLNWPSLWRQNGIKTSKGDEGVPVSVTKKGDVWVAASPFAWMPVPLPQTNDHYCLISRVSTERNPNNIPDAGTLDDFAKFVANNRGFAWHNVTMVTGNPPTWSQNIRYDQGDEEGYIYVFLKCTNIPNGCEVAFSCGKPGPQPLINLNKTAITTYPSQAVGIYTRIPAGFSSYINYSFWANGRQIPGGASITLQAIFPMSPGHELEPFAAHLHELQGTTNVLLVTDVGPQKGLIVGQDTMAYRDS